MHFPSSWDLRPQPCPYQTTQVGFSLKLVDPQTWTRIPVDPLFTFKRVFIPEIPGKSWPQHPMDPMDPMDPSCVRWRNLFWVPLRDAGEFIVHRGRSEVICRGAVSKNMGFPWRGLTRPAGGVSLVCCGNKKKRSIKVLEREVSSVLIEHI